MQTDEKKGCYLTWSAVKEFVLFKNREISLKVNCEKVKFSICDICNNFNDYE